MGRGATEKTKNLEGHPKLIKPVDPLSSAHRTVYEDLVS